MTTEDDPRTDLEKRLEWVCDAWQDALAIDREEEWRGVRFALYGATQTLIMGDGRHKELEALQTLGSVATEHSFICIAAGNYEGAPK